MASTSLAAQLSKGVSLNAPLLADRSRRKHAESYLFTSREADQHDFHSIYSLGVNGLSKLKTLDIKFAKYDDTLFSDAARGLDRTLQSESQNVELDRTIGLFLRDLGPFLLEAPTSKALEWVVKRFRVNEFNLDDVMALFLPYHETPHFAKMVSILHVKESRLWSFLAPLRAAGKPLPRSLLVEEMLASIDLARFATGLLPEALAAGRVHRTLVGFTASVTVEYLTRMKRVEEEIMAFILPAVTRSFASDSSPDCALAGYISLATLSQRCRLTPAALVAVIAGMIKGQRHVKSQQILPLLVAVAGPQDQLEEFSDSTTDSIVRLPGVIEALPDCLSWAEAEKLVLPLLPSLVRRANEASCANLLDALMMSPTVPNPIIERYTELLLESILRLADPSDSAVLRFLSVIYQRHGAVFSETSERLLRAIEDRDERQTFEGVLRSVALPSSFSTIGNRGKWIVSSNAADVSGRVIAVRELLKALAVGDVNAEPHEDLRDALRARVVDTNPTVIETLYSDPENILPIIDDVAFVESISKALAAPGISRPVMRLHFAFMAGEFCGHNMNLAPAIFEHIYIPYILFTKPRQKTAALVWQSLRHSKLADYELFAGCMDIVFAQPAAEGVSQSVEEMATINLAVTTKIAGNIVASNVYPRHLDMLLGLLNGSDAHTTIVSYLLLRSLLDQLSGEHRVDAAQRILKSMGLQSLDTLHDVMTNAKTLQDVISDEALSKSVVLKPSSAGTTHRLQTAILALFPVVPRPVDVKIDWLGDGPLESSDMRGKHFVELARAIYSLANSSSAAQFLSTSILRALFVNLREQTLLFLAGIWSTSLETDKDSTNLPVAALFHGAAFLKAQADNELSQDFQVIVPSLLIALQSRHRAVRSAAIDCVAIISQNSSSTTSPTIYALDSVYGSSSDGLQYLEWSDFGRYVSSLHSRREHFINDGDYLGVFQQEMLRKERSDNKKEAGYKKGILCYTLSHAIVWSTLEARVALLTALKNVPHRAKLQMLLPLIQRLVSGDAMLTPRDDEQRLMEQTYSQLLLETFDETAAPDLNEAGSGSWITFVRLTRFAFVDEAATLSLRNTIVQQLRGGLFNFLTVERQREICIALVESGAISPDSHLIVKETLAFLLKDVVLMTSLLTHFQPTGADSSQRASKRARLAPEPKLTSAESSLRPMTVLVEVLVAYPMPGSVELMSVAIEALTRVFHVYASQSDANYLMQLLMSMLESVASSITDTATLPPSSIRMDILVEILRVVDNPQTFNQTLLLIASLARLAPDFVMQNVMPVFTFMGSNVFHRDDSYSFRVVQKTVESIVPVVIASLRAKHTASLDLQIASREFLRVFTDAATHVPRHRRTQFFNHLVEVIGPQEFTASICLLLVDKISNRIIRQKSGEAANALNLPLIILQANFKATPFKVVEQLLQECTRLLFRITDPDSTVHDTFLDLPQDSDQTASTSTKRQIQAILIFVDLVLQQSSRKGTISDENAIHESVRLLLGLVNLDHGSAASQQFPEVSRVALKALGHLLRVISAVEFASAIGTILASSNHTAESGAMNLFASRLVNITPKTRQDISPTIVRITEHACNRLKNSQDLATLKASLKALCAVAQTAVGQETLVLTSAIPLVLHVAVDQKSLAADVLACILPLSAKIGPRILPFFRSIVEFCSDILTQTQSDAGGEQIRLEEDAQAILVALLSTLSQFWGIDELMRLATLSLGARPTSLTLRKTLAKRTPAKQLLPALFRVWPELAVVNPESLSRREAFFDLFKRVVRSAPREDVHEHLRQTFKLFLEAFDTNGEHSGQDAEASENASLAAFVEVVTKLNEAAFKPMFRRLFDWAFNDNTVKPANRQITFCRAFTALIKFLKGFVTPYMGMVLSPLTEILESYRANRKRPPKLWLAAVHLFETSMTLDEGAFWRTDKLRKLTSTLVAQIEVCPSFNDDDARQTLKTCLTALVAATDDDSLLKKLNLELLMQTRSDDAQVRLFALDCAQHIWHGHGEKLSGFVSDVVTFIAECADDEHDEVAKAARGLKRTVESRCGSLDVLMQ